MKKFFSAFLLMTAMVLSVGTFVACNDLTDEITGVQSQASQNAAAISAIESEITALEGQIATAQKAADDAAAAAKAAQGTADEAKALAAQAATKAELEALQTAVNDLKALKTAVEKNTADIATVNTEIAAIKEEINGLKTQLAALENFKAAVEAAMPEYAKKAELEAAIEAVEAALEGKADTADVEALQAMIEAIEEELVVLAGALHSIVFVPEVMVDGVDAIKFTSFTYVPVTKDAENNNEKKPNGRFYMDDPTNSISEPVNAAYHFNPSSFDLTKGAYDYLGYKVAFEETKAGVSPIVSDLVTIDGAPAAANGVVNFTLRRTGNGILPVAVVPAAKTNMIALRAKVGEAYVVSTYAHLLDNATLLQKDLYVARKKDDFHLPRTLKEAMGADSHFQVEYGQTIDLKPLVSACLGNMKDYNVEKNFNFTYAFSKVEKFEAEDGETITEQQRVLSQTDATTFTAENSKEAIGRTPIVKIEIKDAAGKVVRYAYAKIQVTAKNIEARKETVTLNFTYKCDGDKEYIGAPGYDKTTVNTPFDEAFFQNLYKSLENGSNVGISHEEFWQMYEYDEKNSTVGPKIVTTASENGTATRVVAWEVEYGKELVVGTPKTGTVVLKNTRIHSEFPPQINLSIVLNVAAPKIANQGVLPEKQILFWKNDEYMINASVPANTTAPSSEFTISNDIDMAFLNLKPQTYFNTKCTSGWFEITKIINGKNVYTKDFATKGVNFDNTTSVVSLDHTNTALKAMLNSADGLKVEFAYMVKTDGVKTAQVAFQFVAAFVKPVTLNINEVSVSVDADDNGYDIDFASGVLLKDWRGMEILAPGTESIFETYTKNEWVMDCDRSHYTPGYYSYPDAKWVSYTETHVVKEGTTIYKASVPARRLSFESVEVTEETIAKVAVLIFNSDFRAAVQNKDLNKMIDIFAEAKVPGVVIKEATLVAEKPADTKDYAKTNLESTVAKLNIEIENSLNDWWVNWGLSEFAYWTYDSSAIEYEPIVGSKEVVEVETGYKYVAGEPVWNESVATPCPAEPTEDGKYIGQRVGCHTWQAVEHTAILDPYPGQYWYFYGMEPINFDLKKATAALADGTKVTIPEGALTWKDGVLKYNNVTATLTTDYVITIPASQNYKFGTVTANLVVNVDTVLE